MSRAIRIGMLLAGAALALLAGCGGNSTEVTITGGGLSGGATGPVVVADSPTGPNTTEIVVDTGPSTAFALGAANIPYVTVTVCEPGSASACTQIDHVFLDTGSIGLRVFRRAVSALNLPAVPLTGGPAAECYPFVLGAVWGALAQADVRIGGELAPALPIQLIDDGSTLPAPADCAKAANGGLLSSPASLQANGILGIGMLRYDCGLNCVTGNYAGGYTLYYACPGGAPPCTPAAVPAAQQAQNPVSAFLPGADGVANDNGSIVVLPAVPDLGASLVKGRLVFGIGTQANNQLSPTATITAVDPDPASSSYLYLASTVAGQSFPNSYIDSGSNALFFDDSSLPTTCKSTSGGSSGGWYCPGSVWRTGATITGHGGANATVDLAVANADVLFSGGNVAFANLGGSAGQGAGTFVWGLPFFYGRRVYTSIWGQALSANGPWNAF